MYCTLVQWSRLDWFNSTSQFRLGNLSQSCPKSPNRRRCKKSLLHWNMEITSQLYVTYCVTHKILSNSLLQVLPQTQCTFTFVYTSAVYVYTSVRKCTRKSELGDSILAFIMCRRKTESKEWTVTKTRECCPENKECNQKYKANQVSEI